MKPKVELFRFCGYDFDVANKQATFDYSIQFSDRDPLNFTETIVFPEIPNDFKKESVENFLEPLHIILGISYYKLYFPSKIELSFDISNEQADFWNIVYRKGLGEFMYKNNLDPESIAKFPYSDVKKSTPVTIDVLDHALLGIGGGKDSIVAAELLKDFTETTSFLIETQRSDETSERVIKEIGNPSLKIKRLLDPKIFEKYEDSYNGHIPISAIFAFLGLLTSAIYKFKYIIVGNEYSSNFGNINYKGEVVNHQWSKSAEFEALLQEYTRKFITLDITYFSILRQFHEIRIAEMFSKYKKYFKVFSSCNRNFRVSKDRPSSLWCCECPKCAFVFLMFAPFFDKEELSSIFDKNLFADSNLIPMFNDLLGFGDLKPFDCVGTFEEARAALYLASQKFKDDIVIKTLLPKIEDPEKAVENVFRTNAAFTLPTPFRFLGIKNVCILGYGKEGKTTEKYIKENYPNLEVGILDQSLDKDYLEKQKNYDLAIKTPGIPKTKVIIPYVTATNIFFSKNKNFTIGITGSKGKSTTSSLIYAILKSAGKNVSFIGNIGNPMISVFDNEIKPDEIFVIELSSYMLDDIEYSPNIAVLLNLFPEHMDYHGGVENYYNAKRNIFKFQKSGDFSVQPPFNEEIPIKIDDIPLLGDHNIKNIQTAIQATRILGVSDSAIIEAVKNFQPLPHRLEFVGLFNGIKFYDDAISTTPQSTIMAINSLKDVDTIFLGGEDRGYDFNELEKVLRDSKIKNIVLFPDTGKRILKSFSGFNILETRDMQEAVKFAFENTREGKICLLSTASPSYSVWKNFEEKGDLFQRFVNEYSNSNKKTPK